MNLSLVKKVYSGLPYIIKAPFSGFFRKELIENPIFKEHFEKLQDAASWTDEQLQAEQFRLYQDTLLHAYEHTKYYKELFDSVGFDPYKVSSFDSIKTIPVLTKQILKERLPDLLADDISDSYLVTTGGTSGEPTKVMMTNDAYYIEWAFVYDFWSKYGYDIHSSKLATFRGINLGKKLYEINPMYQEIRMNVFSMSRGNIEKYVKEMKRYGTDVIYGYPSAIYNFCKLAQEAGIPVNKMFKAALLISENLYPFQEEKIREVLECPIGMFYGHSERAVFAGKYDKGYQFHPLYGVTEISENGEPIVTGFINRKTPLIRYVVDDRITEIEPDFFRVEGHRNSEVIYGRNGEEFRASTLDFHGSLSEIISNYQFVQNEPGKLIIRVLESDNNSDEAICNAINHINENLNHQFDVDCEIAKELQYSSGNVSRKYKLHIQNVPGGVVLPKQFFNVIGHHNGDVLYGMSGEEISAAAINFHDKTFAHVSAYQFRQSKVGYCTLCVVPSKDFKEKDIQSIKKAVSGKLGQSVICEVEAVDSISLTERGKYKMILQSPELVKQTR